jgi:hypothetical protein
MPLLPEPQLQCCSWSRAMEASTTTGEDEETPSDLERTTGFEPATLTLAR